jgi:hypothetical protein
MQLNPYLFRELRFFDIRLIIIFVITRSIFLASGVSFISDPLTEFWQYLDVGILSENLAEGLLYLHSQPPLFNFFLGITLKLFPENHPYILQLVFMLCGYLVYASTCKILTLNGMRTWVAIAIGTLIAIRPDAILYENYLIYSWPIAALLMCAAYALWANSKNVSLRHLMTFVVCVTAVCLIRSVFHLIFFAGAAVFALLSDTKARRTVYVLVISMAAVVLSVFLKNLILFGFFGSSSWMGMNSWHVFRGGVDATSIEHAVKKEIIPPIGLYKPFGALETYPEKFAAVPEKFRAIESLSAPEKRVGGLNFNHYAYIAISKEYKDASLKMMLNYPLKYIGAILQATKIYFVPADINPFMQENVATLKPYINTITARPVRKKIESVVIGSRSKSNSRASAVPRSSYLFMPLMLLIAAYYTVTRVRKDGARKTLPMLFMMYTICYVAVISVMFELGENYRFHVMTDPLLLTIVALAIRSWLIESGFLKRFGFND